MYDVFSAKNYRCFSDLTVGPLERVNLIAGENNVGKTALLEALFIFDGLDPRLVFMVESFRGLNQSRTDEFLWDLFVGFDPNNVITLSGKDSSGAERFLDITSQKHPVSRVKRSNFRDRIGEKLSSKGVAEEALRTYESEIVFQIRDSYGERQMRAFFDEDDEISFERPSNLERPNLDFLLSRSRENPQMLAIQLSRLRESKNHLKIVETLQIIENRLNDLEVLSNFERNMIYGDIGYPRLIPISLMGEGLGRLLEIALAIVETQDGILLIDEIENGFHYSVMSKVWRAIANLAREYNVQIFATTHSWECIEAAHNSFCEDTNYDFRFHRLQSGDHKIQAITFDQDSLHTTLEEGWEIR